MKLEKWGDSRSWWGSEAENGLDAELAFYDKFFERAGNWLRGDGFWTDDALETFAAWQEEWAEEDAAIEEQDEEAVEGVEFGLDDEEDGDVFEDDEDDDEW